MNRKKYYQIFALLAVLFFTVVMVSGCKKQSGSTTPATPNIIFYLADDQDIYDYGCYGNDKITTPGVDRLASEGLTFENAFTGQAICAPSRSQLYTGNYPLKNGCFLNHIKTKGGQKSIIKYMRKLGYEVILAGKSHVGPKKIYDWDQEWRPVKKEGTPRHYLPLNKIKEYFDEHIWSLKKETVDIAFATLGEDAGIIGTAALAKKLIDEPKSG